MPGLEEVVIGGQLARPDLPAGCPLCRSIAQAVDWPIPTAINQRPTDTNYAILLRLLHGYEHGGTPAQSPGAAGQSAENA
jgi:hypothetical protein